MTPSNSPRQRRIARWSIVPIAVVASGLLVSTASYAAFTATTDNTGNAWASGAISLTDDDQGEAMFDVADMQPGSTGSQCITVTATGSLATTVALYADNPDSTGALADHIDLVIDHGTADDVDCDGFVSGGSVFEGSLAEFATEHTDHANGVDAWAVPAGGTERTYRISYELAADAPNTTQGTEAGIDFVWESRTA